MGRDLGLPGMGRPPLCVCSIHASGGERAGEGPPEMQSQPPGERRTGEDVELRAACFSFPVVLLSSAQTLAPRAEALPPVCSLP